MFEHTESFDYEVMDECSAVVSSRYGDGVFLTLDNGEKAYAYRFGNLIPGEKVLCRIERLPKDDMRSLVSISSVYEYRARAA